MTTPESTVEEVEVTQADREAAWPHRRPRDFTRDYPSWLAGKYDNVAPIIQAFTRHRIASLPAATDHEPVADKYLVWSNEHSAWWGRDRCGYTRIIANAGRYSRAEALCIAGTRDGGWHVRKGNPDEIAIPEQDALDQYADITREQEAALITRTRKIGGEA